jgi:hypothetical protein
MTWKGGGWYDVGDRKGRKLAVPEIIMEGK